jgi:hypothetical protein
LDVIFVKDDVRYISLSDRRQLSLLDSKKRRERQRGSQLLALNATKETLLSNGSEGTLIIENRFCQKMM